MWISERRATEPVKHEDSIQTEDRIMPISATPYLEPRFVTVNGRRMAYIDEGVSDAIAFQHGNPPHRTFGASSNPSKPVSCLTAQTVSSR